MRCIVVSSLGDFAQNNGYSPLELSEYKEPKLLNGDDVQIAVAYAGVNFFDLLIVQGLYQEKPELPFIPGAEISGIVTEIGKNVYKIRKGDKVIGCCPKFGGFAEVTVLPQNVVFALPEGLNLREAAGFPTVFGTAHLSLKYRANIQQNQSILILGASGGVGSAAVQICLHYNMTIVSVTKGKEKCKFLRYLGVHHVIDLGDCPKKGDVSKQIKKCVPSGVDVLFDVVGGDLFKEGLRTVKWGGTILVLGFAAGTIPSIAANLLLVKNLTVHGVYWGSYMQNMPKIWHQSVNECLQMWAMGQIQVPVSHCFPLSQASQALGVLKDRKAKGKVVLQVGARSSKL
eukprot:TRINITY_DN7365_c0_g1_i7.p1 TRINITY_DN7365_c0_g1~~TRINITY_DN7365_c0_g1_i7.p1  ORF type:complete len:343 (-),score=52.98 TRINITY_DN7365_c0_g1_i7:367-1395(-)